MKKRYSKKEIGERNAYREKNAGNKRVRIRTTQSETVSSKNGKNANRWFCPLMFRDWRILFVLAVFLTLNYFSIALET